MDHEDCPFKCGPQQRRGRSAGTCGGRRLDEVRICLSRELQFRDCPETNRRSCRRDRLVMPPVRGG
jgi:ribonuclease T2